MLLAAARTPELRSVLAGKYRLERRIGAGAMGAVFAARHVGTGRAVAVKRLLPDLALDERARARFEREARAAGRVKSRHVVEILDVDLDDDGVPFLVLELLEGETLAERLRARGRLPPTQAVALACTLLAGVADLHRAGVVHRDLKPGNVFLARDGAGGEGVKLLDFGISKLDADAPAEGGPENLELTHVDEVLGNVSFIPPEQISRSRSAGPAADLWAVGVVLFRMLAGRVPFEGEDRPSIIGAILQSSVPSLAGAGVDADAAARLQPVLERALAKRPEDRYADADAMREALGAAMPAAAQTAPTVNAPSSAAPTAEPPSAGSQTLPGAGVAPPPRSARALPVPGAVALALVAVVGAVLGFVMGAPAASAPLPAGSLAAAAELGEVAVVAGAAPPGDRIDATARGFASRAVRAPDRATAALLVRLARTAEPAPTAEPVPPSPPPAEPEPAPAVATAAASAPSPRRHGSPDPTHRKSPPVIATAPY